MNNPKCYPVYRVQLYLKVKSEEIDESAIIPTSVYDLTYYKRTELPCPPTVGMEVAGLWGAMKIAKIVVFEEHANCFFEDLVRPKEALDKGLAKLEEHFSDDGWTKDSLGNQPQL